MKKQILLRQFEYAIPPSVISFAGVKNNHIVAEHLSLMKVVIDFENGNLNLEGNWNFMVASNTHNRVNWLNYHRERVHIETTIYDSWEINLNDPQSDGLVFHLEGIIKDGNYLDPCSGLVVLDNIRTSNRVMSDQWNICLYLYDLHSFDCEIKFKLPINLFTVNEKLN
jgi:hypothetical protein